DVVERDGAVRAQRLNHAGRRCRRSRRRRHHPNGATRAKATALPSAGPELLLSFVAFSVSEGCPAGNAPPPSFAKPAPFTVNCGLSSFTQSRIEPPFTFCAPLSQPTVSVPSLLSALPASVTVMCD